MFGRITRRLAQPCWRTLALCAGAVALGLAPTHISQAQAAPDGAPCLWADVAYPRGAEEVAGGWHFTCATDSWGAPVWIRGERTQSESTVANPGAVTNPAGHFSPGARQPGTSYNDYCVGSQLIDGSEDVYQVVAHPNGFLQWKYAAPLREWQYSGGDAVADGTWRSSSNCLDGVLS